MTPAETKAMADRIAANRKEAEAKKTIAKPKTEKVAKAKVVKAPRPTAKKVSKERVKPIGPGTKQFKFKTERAAGECDVQGCKVKGLGKKRRCTKHKKEIRKVQLAANNKVWKARVKAGTAGHHVVYTRPGEKKPIATKFSLKATDKAVKVVGAGHSVIEKVGDFKEIVSRTKKELAS